MDVVWSGADDIKSLATPLPWYNCDEVPKKQLTKPSGLLKRLPVLTIGIIAVNVIVYALTCRDFASTALPPESTPAHVYGLVPAHIRLGKMITCNFVHAGLVHLIVNMGMLFLFGRDVERAMGKIEYAMFYIGACFASSAAHVGMVLAAFPNHYANQPVVGASGAVAGVVAIYAVRYHRRILSFLGVDVPALLVILAWLILQLGFGVVGLYRDSFLGLGLKQVSYWSHLGGFAFGLITAYVSGMGLKGEREHLIAEAKRQYENDSLLDAIHNYETLIKYDPDNAFAYAEIGRLWAIREEEEQSLPFYHAAIELYVSRGEELEALARSKEMIEFWPKAKMSAPTRFRIASYLEESGRRDSALQSFRELADDEPESVEAQMALIKVGRLQLSYQKDPAACVRTLNDFLQRYPSSEWRRFAERVLAKAQEA